MNSHAHLAGKTVLLVDDSELALTELQNLFQSLSMSVVGWAKNGLEALSKYDQLHPDLITLDIVMPEMNGIECYRKLKKKSPNQKLLIISFLASEPSVARSFKDIPPEVFQAKPIDRDAITKAVGDMLCSAELADLKAS